MKEELISFDTAKLAKEKGFNLECRHFFAEYHDGSEIATWCNIEWDINNTEAWKPMFNIKAPTQSLLQRWLREKYGIYVSAQWAKKNMDESLEFYPTVTSPTGIIDIQLSSVANYEEAIELGLQEALKLIPVKP